MSPCSLNPCLDKFLSLEKILHFYQSFGLQCLLGVKSGSFKNYFSISYVNLKTLV